MEAFLAEFKHPVHTIVTDNEGGFTDRCAVDKKDKPVDRPSGRHPFDGVCRKHGSKHRLSRPYHSQTDGRVERFNRRLNEAIQGRPAMPGRGGKKFAGHPERDAFVHRFVADCNLTRLKCLDYKAPMEMLHNPAEQYTPGEGEKEEGAPGGGGRLQPHPDRPPVIRIPL